MATMRDAGSSHSTRLEMRDDRRYPADLGRRAFLAASGAIIVTLAAPPGWSATAFAQPAPAGTTRPPFTPDQLDSWIAINPDGTVNAFLGKVDGGQGVDVAIAQIVAEELDAPYEAVTVVMGDTATTINQGGASGSTGVQKGGATMRDTAAEARRVLIELASQRLGVPAPQLTVADAVVVAPADPARRISYAALMGGRFFNTSLQWNQRIGSALTAKGKAEPKRPDQYKIVGTPRARKDVAAKVYASFEYSTDVKVPGMLHGRMIRPPVAGAVPVLVDESSIKDVAGVRVVRVENLIGIVADKEWNAIVAARRLAVAWSETEGPFFEQDELYRHIRRAPVVKREITQNHGSVDSVFDQAQARGLRVIEAEYEWPFQSHASMGPACAIVDAKADSATLWTGSQKPHYARDVVAALLGLDPEKVIGNWRMGPGSYGRNDAGDAAADAAILSKAVGRPVRVQYMRNEGHGWDPKAPASIHRVRAAVDSSGKIIAHEFMTKAFSILDIMSNEGKPAYTLAGHLLGYALEPIQDFGAPVDSYAFEHKRVGWETIPPLLDRASPLRTSHMRATASPQCHFASEQFIDELAVATRSDPIDFRMRYMTDPRDVDVIKAAAERAGWQPRRSTRIARTGTASVTGRGIAMAQKNGTTVAIIADVRVDRSTGQVRPVSFVVAHDCGLIVNPEGLRRTIEGNLIQTTSRTLCEEVKFDRNNVTSVDWESYPIGDITTAPESVEIVLLNRPDKSSGGAGEATCRAVAGALANAVFDATGARIRRAPLTPERVKAALKKA
jgi:CO/xanthine dehydrogenase Mo-binding subunit